MSSQMQILFQQHNGLETSLSSTGLQIEKNYMDLSKDVLELMKNVPGGLASEQDSPYVKERNYSMHAPLQPGPALE
jgi:hypothetical protein